MLVKLSWWRVGWDWRSVIYVNMNVPAFRILKYIFGLLVVFTYRALSFLI